MQTNLGEIQEIWSNEASSPLDFVRRAVKASKHSGKPVRMILRDSTFSLASVRFELFQACDWTERLAEDTKICCFLGLTKGQEWEVRICDSIYNED